MLLQEGGLRFQQVSRIKWRHRHLKRVIDLIFCGLETKTFQASDVCGALIQGLQIQKMMDLKEHRADNAALYIHSKQGQIVGIRNKKRKAVLVSKAKLFQETLSVHAWSRHLDTVREELEDPDCQFSLMEFCIDQGRYTSAKRFINIVSWILCLRQNISWVLFIRTDHLISTFRKL